MLSARDTARLFDLADRHDARIILVGDVKQLGSVEAGAAFAQLQGTGMETAKLAEIVRQANTTTKDAVRASIEGDTKKALAALDRGGGQIIENADRAERFAAIAERYAGLDKAGRARTLVIEPSREGRDALTADIRAALARSGALTGPAVTMQSLANKGLTRAEARDPMSYDKGDVVRFTSDYVDKGVTRGEAYRVESIDPAKAAISLKSEDGREAHAYVDTAFAAQGRTADHVMIHADSRATNLVDQKSFYVGVSRAKESATIFTNDRGKLVSAINERAGQVQTAIAHIAMPTPAAGQAAGAGLG